MISVEIQYLRKKMYGDDAYIFTDFKVEGHANDGSPSAIKCCAGVTAITLGLTRIMTGLYDKLIISKGLFHYTCDGIKSGHIDWQTHYALNCMLCQLFEIQKIYPQFFKTFEMIERKN